MGQGSRWIASNLARFSGLWLAALTIGALAIPGPSRFPVPHSIVGIVLLPLAVFVTVFLAVVAALVAFVFFSPVLALWLVVYLVVIFGLARALPSDRSARLAGTLAAPLLWAPFVDSGERLVDDVSLAVVLRVRPARETLADKTIRLEEVHWRDACLEWAKARGLHKLTLSVFPHNEARTCALSKVRLR